MAEKYKANTVEQPERTKEDDAQDVASTVGKELGSVYLQAHGVPAPVADMLSGAVVDSKLGKAATKQIANNPVAKKALSEAKPIVDKAKPLLDAKKQSSGSPSAGGGTGNIGKSMGTNGKGLASTPGVKKPFFGQGLPNQGIKKKQTSTETNNEEGSSSLKSGVDNIQKKKEQVSTMKKIIMFLKKNPWAIKFIAIGALFLLLICAVLFIVISIEGEGSFDGIVYSSNTIITLIDENGNPLGVVSVEDYVAMNVAQITSNNAQPNQYLEFLAISERSRIYSENDGQTVITWTGNILYAVPENIIYEINNAVTNTNGKVFTDGEYIKYLDYTDVIINENNKDTGINLSQALSLANEGKTLEEIYLTFYSDKYKIDIVVKPGLVNTDGFSMRVSKPEFYGFNDSRNNPFYYSNANAEYPNLMGECVWYSFGRANEILNSIGSSNKWSYWGNGGSFCDSNNVNKYQYVTTTDYTKPVPGSIVSWKNSSYGHVAIIENVTYDSQGNVIGVSITEGGMGLGYYSRSSGRYWFSTVSSYDRNNIDVRNFNCNTYNGTSSSGCFRYSEYVPISSIKNYSGSFQCYIYLTQPN